MFLPSPVLDFIFKQDVSPSVHVCLPVLQILIPPTFFPARISRSPDLFTDPEWSLLQRPGRRGLQVQVGTQGRAGTSPLGLSLADNWDHSSDAKSGAIEPGSEWHSGPPSAVDHPPAPDKRPGPDHRHSHREPDPASDQHPGHHTLTHQARPAGKGSTSPYHLPPVWFQSMESNF